MSSKLKQPSTKLRQFEVLVQFMKEHKDLAGGTIKGSSAKQTSDQLWAQLAEDLNSNGPPTHTVAEWKKIWIDYKYHIKVKITKNRLNTSGSNGCGTPKLCSLTKTEEQVVELLNMNDAIERKPGTADVPHSTSMASPKSRNGKENRKKVEVDNHTNYQKDCVNKLEEISENLKSVNRYARKTFELKEKSLALKREKFTYKKKRDVEKMGLVLKKLELKKKILELQRPQ